MHYKKSMQMVSKQLPQEDTLAEQLLELAIKCRAEAAEVYQSRSLSRPVFFEGNRLKQIETNEAEGTALRLWRNGCPGVAVAYGPAEPKSIVDKALALSMLNPPEFIQLGSNFHPNYSNLGEDVPIEKLINWGQQTIDTIRTYYPDVVCNGDWECDVETTRLVNTKGLDCYYTDTTLSSYISAEWVRGEDFLSVSDGETERCILQPEKVAAQILQRLDWAKNKITAPNCHVPILFTSKASDMLWSAVQEALNGKQILERASPWANKFGQRVTSSQLTLYQDPKAGPYSCPFDDEGTPSQSVIFVENGILQHSYCDHSVGKQLQVNSTGNGFRPDLGSYPTPSLFNFLVQPGLASLQELIVDMDYGLIIDQILGKDGGISGDFSINVELGYLVKNGQVFGRVKDTMVTGNIYDALKQLVYLGGDADWNGSYYTPSLVVEGLSIISKE